MELLDTPNTVAQRDSKDALGIAAMEWQQLQLAVTIVNEPATPAVIEKIIVTGMGGSALAASIVKDWLDLPLPFEIIKGYTLPKYVDKNTLVIASSYSGNTEETLSALEQATHAGAHVAILSSGGQLVEIAVARQITHVVLPSGMQPRMAVFGNLVALVGLLENYGLIHGVLAELQDSAEPLRLGAVGWSADVPTEHNYAKQLALGLAGKTVVIYAGSLFRSVAYKWKISCNENAKNVAFMNELPEFNHNEFMGWASHPVEKPFGVINLVSSHDHPQIKKRFEISDRLLSGKRPHATTIRLEGDSLIAQMLWGSVLADYVSIYLAILNGVDPTPVDLIEKLKKELA